MAIKRQASSTAKKNSNVAAANSTSIKRKVSRQKDNKKSPAKVAETSLNTEDDVPTSVSVRTPGFPIVGIGASAGGLEALEELFENMPAKTGMAFVVVTHQHPGHTSLLPDLLAKVTELPVVAPADGQKVEPDHVYVGPPGGQIAILNGTLHRMETEKAEAPRLPIDYF